MAKNSPKPVNEGRADAIHDLLADCMETSLRQALLTGEVNPALLGKVIDWLKHNNIRVTSEADKPLASLASLVAELDLDRL